MAILGKLITAAGGVLIALFSLAAWIVVLASDDYASRHFLGMKANAVLQGLLMMVLGGAIAAGALLMFDKCAKCLAITGGLVVFLSTPWACGSLIYGGLNFYIILGGLVAIAGACSGCCCKLGACESKDQPPMATPVPPESKL